MSMVDALRIRLRSARPIVGLALVELRRSRWSKLAWVGALLPAVLALASDSENKGHQTPTAALASLSTLVAWTTWTCGGTLAFAASQDLRCADTSGGLRRLFAERGISDRAYVVARAVALSLEVWARLTGTWVAALLLVAAVLRSASLIRFVPQFIGYSLGVAVVLAALASGCSALGTGRGRLLFMASLLLPWLLAGEGYGAAFSVPGLLDNVWSSLAPSTSLAHGAGP